MVCKELRALHPLETVRLLHVRNVKGGKEGRRTLQTGSRKGNNRPKAE